MINKLIELNNKLIESSISNEQEYQKQILISKLLKEPNCFMRMSIEQAYGLLRDLKVPEEKLKNIYSELIDINNIKPE